MEEGPLGNSTRPAYLFILGGFAKVQLRCLITKEWYKGSPQKKF